MSDHDAVTALYSGVTVLRIAPTQGRCAVGFFTGESDACAEDDYAQDQGCTASEAALPAGVVSRVAGPHLLALIGTLTGGYRLSKQLVQGLLAERNGTAGRIGAELIAHASSPSGTGPGTAP